MRIRSHTVGFLVVHSKVLDTGTHTVALHTTYVGGGNLTRHQRVFGIILEVTSAKRVTVNVQRRSQQHVRTVFQHFVTDGLTYTFHLKEGVKFSDGADLNAEAVKTSLEAAFSNLGAYIASFGKIGTLTESIEVVDEHTVAIHLTTPYYGVLNDLAMCNPMGIVSPNAIYSLYFFVNSS